MVKAVHVVPIKGFLVINEKDHMEITNLRKIYNESCEEIVLEQRN